MKRFGLVLVLSGLVGMTGFLASTPTAQAGPPKAAPPQAGPPCGEKGLKLCPLQKWMEDNVQIPMEKKDMKALAAALEKAASLAPDPAWNTGDKGWEKLAKQGVAAAKSGDLKATKKTCKTCHKAWRKKYKAEHRMKPVKG